MKRILITIILSLGIAYIQAQDKLLMPTATSKYKDANHPTNVLLTKNCEFCYYQSGTLDEFNKQGLSFNYDNMTLTYCETRVPTPEEEKKDPKFKYPWHNKYEMVINKEQADALFSLFTAVVYSSSYMGEDGFIMDGSYCRFTAGQRSGCTNSPSSKSNCGRLLRIVWKLFQHVKEQNPTAIDGMMNEIKSLTDIFISYYPCEIPKNSYIYNIHKKHKVKGNSVGLKD